MTLLTESIKKELRKHPLYSTEEVDDIKECDIIVKFFGGSSCTWLVLEGEEQSNGNWEFFGYANLGYGWELGNFTLNELKGIKFPPFGLGVERDAYLGKKKVKDIIKD